MSTSPPLVLRVHPDVIDQIVTGIDGKELRRLESESGARIYYDKNQQRCPFSSFVSLVVSGSDGARQSARNSLNCSLERQVTCFNHI